MTPTVASALLAMSTSPNRQDAAIWANEAKHRGATEAELAVAWLCWEREADASVHMIDLVMAGTTSAVCACSHIQSSHHHDRHGRPLCVGPCGCGGFREVAS